MLKNLLLKKMMKSQLKGVPEEEQGKMIKLVQENPKLFQKIGLEIQAKVKEGKEQMLATMEVMKKNQEEIKKIM